jgi:hypothetical protein
VNFKALLLLSWCAGLVASQEMTWDIYKQTHSVVLMVKHGVTNKDRYIKLRLDEMVEDGQTSPDGDTYTYFGSGDFLPRGTTRGEIVPQDSVPGYTVQRVIEAGEEKFNYVVLALNDPFEKCFHMLCSADYSVVDVAVVPN